MVTAYNIEDTTEYPSSSGGGGKILSVFCRGGRKFFDITSAGKLHPPPTHRKNDTSLICEYELHTLPNAKVDVAKDHGENHIKVRPPLVCDIMGNGLSE